MKQLVQDHTAGNQQSWALKLSGLILETALHCDTILNLAAASCPVVD